MSTPSVWLVKASSTVFVMSALLYTHVLCSNSKIGQMKHRIQSLTKLEQMIYDTKDATNQFSINTTKKMTSIFNNNKRTHSQKIGLHS
ncbi:hypothetical protein BCR42DRAFT_440626 [Absidia repens]|uniref:Uncharacterized protein n=1 Tax=Absidia repens TaxID=90262 RepID=A0A1X2I8L8_9FUNG|nr:hypothetical protein BCR42DRAFT_440626 [Absidia repens]